MNPYFALHVDHKLCNCPDNDKPVLVSILGAAWVESAVISLYCSQCQAEWRIPLSKVPVEIHYR